MYVHDVGGSLGRCEWMGEERALANGVPATWYQGR